MNGRPLWIDDRFGSIEGVSLNRTFAGSGTGCEMTQIEHGTAFMAVLAYG